VRYVECGVIEPPSRLALPFRLAEIGEALAEILVEHRPACVAVEGVFHGKNARSALQLGHARGVALYQAGRAGLEVFEYAPMTVKRSVTGSGRASKEQVSAMVRTVCGLRRTPQLDASDALAVALCHVLRLGVAGRVRVSSSPSRLAAGGAR
jgi:crossover junction endodeoxyribonuclease RuvC